MLPLNKTRHAVGSVSYTHLDVYKRQVKKLYGHKHTGLFLKNSVMSLQPWMLSMRVSLYSSGIFRHEKTETNRYASSRLNETKYKCTLKKYSMFSKWSPVKIQ